MINLFVYNQHNTTINNGEVIKRGNYINEENTKEAIKTLKKPAVRG